MLSVVSAKLLIVLHLLGACIWTGGHLVLALAVLPRALRERSPDVIREFESGFERLGIPALLVQVLTGVLLTSRFFPDLRQLLALDSPVAIYVVAKLGLLLLTVMLALHARLRIIPTLSRETLPKLAWHIRAVTLTAVLFVVFGAGIHFGGW